MTFEIDFFVISAKTKDSPLSDLTSAAEKWASREQSRINIADGDATRFNPPSGNSASNWATLRPRFVSAISKANMDIGATPPGSSSIGPFTLTADYSGTTQYQPGVTTLELIGLIVECKSPAINERIYIRAMYNNTALIYSQNNSRRQFYTIDKLLAVDVEAVVRRAVLEAISPPYAPLPDWPA